MGACRLPTTLLGTPSPRNRWRAGVPPLPVTPPLRRRPALAARPHVQLGRHDRHGAARDSSEAESSSSSAAAADGEAGQAAPDLPRISGGDAPGTSEASTSGASATSSSSSSSAAEALAASQSADLGSSSAEAESSGVLVSSVAASGAAEGAAPAEAATAGADSSSDGGGFKASMLFHGGSLDWQALRSLQPPKAQPPQQPQAQLQGDAKAATVPLAAGLPSAAHIGTLWGLLVLSLAYLHHSTSGFALPALLPIISEDMKLSDTQGALLTAGYTVGAAACCCSWFAAALSWPALAGWLYTRLLRCNNRLPGGPRGRNAARVTPVFRLRVGSFWSPFHTRSRSSTLACRCCMHWRWCLWACWPTALTGQGCWQAALRCGAY